MDEIRFHGRGGQGTVVASKLLAYTFFALDLNVQSFPMFGVERRGAPVTAFLRIQQKRNVPPLRSEISHPSCVVVLDPVLMDLVDPFEGMRENGLAVVNSPSKLENSAFSGNTRVASVDATRIATEFGIGSESEPIVNTAITGAFLKAFEPEQEKHLEVLLSVIDEEIPSNVEKNKKAARAAYERVQLPEPDLYEDARGIVWRRNHL